MSETPGIHDKQKASKIRLKPEHDSTLRPTFAAARHSVGDNLWNRGQPAGGLLQRQCSCGTYTGGGGECEACRHKHESGVSQGAAIQREVSHNSKGFGEGTLTHIGPDFSQIPVQTFASASAGLQSSLKRNTPRPIAEQETTRVMTKRDSASARIVQRQCPCEAKEEEDKNPPVQTKRVGESSQTPAAAGPSGEKEAANQEVVQRGIVDDIANWIDLLGPKQALMDHMTDSSWIVNQVSEIEKRYEANPKHDLVMNLKLFTIGMRAAAEAQNYVERIRDCNDRSQIDALRLEFDVWKAVREVMLVLELEQQVEEYREIERGWLQAFNGAAPVTKDPVHPNGSAQSVALSLKGGVPQAIVTVETRVNCTFQLTAQAMQDNNGDGNPDVAPWTPDEMTHFMARFQKQLDDVWSTGAGDTIPFRCTAPKDYLLSDESPKWSEVTAKMVAKVSLDTTNPHFQLKLFKEAPGENNRAFVSNGGGTFYLTDADAGYKATSGPEADVPTGAQHTLAHEWHHMIGNPDEYSENSAAQSADPGTPADLQGNWGACQQHFNNIINNPSSTPDQVQQARQDLQALQNHATDVDPATPGFQSGIFPLAGRTDIPDSCFAIRGSWRSDQAGHLKLRPGAMSQRGGTNISKSAEDAARLSDRGNQVRPYMHEGIVQELQGMLKGKFDPEVNFDHNFQDMTPQQVAETLQTRIQNVLHDIKNLGASKAPPGEAPPGASHDHHDH